MQNARVRIVGRVARATMFATAAAALSDCGTTNVQFYGGPCLADPDACAVPQDAGNDVNSVPFYGGSCPGNFCPDASDASDDATDDATDASDAADAKDDAAD